MSLEPEPTHAGFTSLGTLGHEIVFHANSLERAEYAAELLLAADSLCGGAWSLFGDSIVVMAEDPPDDPAELARHRRFMERQQGSAGGLHFAIIVAARASHQRKHQYALFKMRLSYLLCSVHVIDLDPSHWWPGRAVTHYASHHVAAASAIQSAYSAIEEIGLEIRASADNPSKVHGRWNPKVLDDLRHRLRRSRIDLSESIIWHKRDTPTLVERRFPPESIKKAAWAGGKIRDVEMQIEDAILYASRLRSKVTAHRLPRIAASLTHYDVTNVQHVARRLILESLGCWRRIRET